MTSWWRWICVPLALAVVASCTPGGGEGARTPGAPQQAEAPLTVEEYVDESHAVCEQYLGELFVLAQQDEHLDTSRDDASRELFLRRARDIAELYASYRSAMAALTPPEDLAPVHEEIIDLMADNREAMAAVGEAHARGEGDEAAALMVESSRIEDEIAARQDPLGIRPCGR